MSDFLNLLKVLEITANPFKRLKKTTLFPNSRILFSSFKQRLRDTFYIFNGGFIRNKLGILDYVFPLPRLLNNLLIPPLYFVFNDEVESKDSVPKFLAKYLLKVVLVTPVVLMFALASVLNLVKSFAAVCLTALTLPIIASIHLYFKSKRDKLIDQTNELLVKPISSPVAIPLNEHCQHSDQIQNLLVKPIVTIELINGKPKQVISLGIYLPCYEPDALGFPTFIGYQSNHSATIMLNASNYSKIKSMLEMNRFKATVNIERINKEFLQELIDTCKASEKAADISKEEKSSTQPTLYNKIISFFFYKRNSSSSTLTEPEQQNNSVINRPRNVT